MTELNRKICASVPSTVDCYVGTHDLSERTRPDTCDCSETHGGQSAGNSHLSLLLELIFNICNNQMKSDGSQSYARRE